jgi:hypothetical protein
MSSLLSLEKSSRTFAERILATLEDIPLPGAGAKRAFGSTLVAVLLVQPLGRVGYPQGRSPPILCFRAKIRQDQHAHFPHFWDMKPNEHFAPGPEHHG